MSSETRANLIARKLDEILDTDGHVPLNVIEVRSGAFVDPLDLDPELVFIEDIAYALSNCARFSGHSGSRGAEHALIVVDILERMNAPYAVQLFGLLHDAHEAYLCDVPKPLKRLRQFMFYRKACDRAQARIYEGFNLPTPTEWDSSFVKQADDMSLFVEARRGLPSRGNYWPGDRAKMRVAVDDLGPDFDEWHHQSLDTILEGTFLSSYRRLRMEAGL